MSRSKQTIPSQSEFGQMRAFLAQKGISQVQIKQAIGEGQYTRAEIVAKLTVFCQQLPKQQ